jgi:hypothetical protein
VGFGRADQRAAGRTLLEDKEYEGDPIESASKIGAPKQHSPLRL